MNSASKPRISLTDVITKKRGHYRVTKRCVTRLVVDRFSRVGNWHHACLQTTGGSAMSSNDVEYYRKRANDERRLALAASQQNVSAIHEELAKQYQALVDQAELRPKLRINFVGSSSSDKSAA